MIVKKSIQLEKVKIYEEIDRLNNVKELIQNEINQKIHELEMIKKEQMKILQKGGD